MLERVQRRFTRMVPRLRGLEYGENQVINPGNIMGSRSTATRNTNCLQRRVWRSYATKKAK